MTTPLLAHDTLRIPRGLWADLEETAIQQDRQFLTEVARSLGLPVQEVLRKCLGASGTPTQIPVLWAGPTTADPDEDICPWWEHHGDGLWRRCPRLRLSDSMPCHIHERNTTCAMARLDSDPAIRELPFLIPVRWEDAVYWINPADERAIAFREDGTTETTGHFRRVIADGEESWAWVPTDLNLPPPNEE